MVAVVLGAWTLAFSVAFPRYRAAAHDVAEQHIRAAEFSVLMQERVEDLAHAADAISPCHYLVSA
jgi:hypothetical protein